LERVEKERERKEEGGWEEKRMREMEKRGVMQE